MKIKLSSHFTYGKLIRFVLPSIGMMIFMSIYTIVDGIFVSNFVGKTAFAALNLIYPLLMILGAIGFMLGAGGAAIIGKTLGEGDRKKANEYFSMFVYAAIIAGIILAAAGIIFIKPISIFLGARGEVLRYSMVYGIISLLALPFFMLQFLFQTFFATAEKNKLGLYITVAAGLANILLDYLFVVVFPFGLGGAAAATGLSQAVGGLLPIIYFSRENDSLLRLTKTKFYKKTFLKACSNGSSELVSNSAASIVTMLYNFQLLRFAGNDGVVAYGVIAYLSFIFAGVYFGYAIGSGPIFSYNYGSKNWSELKNMFRKSIVLLTVTGVFLSAFSFILARPLSAVFVGYDSGLLEMTVQGMRFFSVSFLLAGINIFGSAFFTALNKGGISAAISFMRSLVFQSLSIFAMPLLFGLTGVWAAIIVAEFLSFAFTLLFLISNRKRFHYA